MGDGATKTDTMGKCERKLMISDDWKFMYLENFHVKSGHSIIGFLHHVHVDP